MDEKGRYRLEVWRLGQTTPVPFQVYRSDSEEELRELARAHRQLFKMQSLTLKLLDPVAGKVETL